MEKKEVVQVAISIGMYVIIVVLLAVATKIVKTTSLTMFTKPFIYPDAERVKPSNNI